MSPDERLIWYRVAYDETGKRVSCGCACLPIALAFVAVGLLLWWVLR